MKKCNVIGVFAAFLAGGAAITGHAVAAPKIEKAVAPDYPRSAERRGIEGNVRVRIDVTDSGAVNGVEVIEANPAGIFEKAAIKAVEAWKFTSGEAASIEKNIEFKLID